MRTVGPIRPPSESDIPLESVNSGSIRGLVPSVGTDASHDTDISAGACTDDGNAAFMILSSSLTKQIDAAWAVGTNQGGLDGTESVPGTPDASTWYHIWLIRRSDTGVVDALYSESASAPTMPSGYDQKRRIGAVLTDGSANIDAYTAVEVAGGGLEYLWNAPPVDVNVGNVGTSAQTATLSAPLGIVTHAIVSVNLLDTTPASATYLLVTSMDQSDGTPGVTNSTLQVDADGELAADRAVWRTNTSSQIRYRLSQTTTDHATKMQTNGWVDPRRI